MVPQSPEIAPEEVGVGRIQERLENSLTAWMASMEAWRVERWRNEFTLRTLEMYSEYEPGGYIERIAPTPLLMISATEDVITPTEEILGVYERALEPKRLVLLEGGHCDAAYGKGLEQASKEAADWFSQHLED